MKQKRLIILIAVVLLVLVIALVYWATRTSPEFTFYEMNRKQVKNLTRIAESGDGAACWCMALYHLKTEEKYRYWLNKGALYGNAEAEYMKGSLMIGQSGGNAGEALRLLLKSAEKGNASAQYELGNLYYNPPDKTVKKDVKEAEHWYRKAALNGNDRAMEQLAQVLMEDPPDTERLKESYKWWQIVAIRTKQGITLSSAKDIPQRKYIVTSKLSRSARKTSVILRNLDAQARKEAAEIPKWDPFPKTDDCIKLANRAGQ
jgi:TPR repeat protein